MQRNCIGPHSAKEKCERTLICWVFILTTFQSSHWDGQRECWQKQIVGIVLCHNDGLPRWQFWLQSPGRWFKPNSKRTRNFLYLYLASKKVWLKLAQEPGQVWGESFANAAAVANGITVEAAASWHPAGICGIHKLRFSNGNVTRPSHHLGLLEKYVSSHAHTHTHPVFPSCARWESGTAKATAVMLSCSFISRLSLLGAVCYSPVPNLLLVSPLRLTTTFKVTLFFKCHLRRMLSIE